MCADCQPQILQIRSAQLTSPQGMGEGRGGSPGMLMMLNSTHPQQEGVTQSCGSQEAVTLHVHPPVSTAGPLCAQDHAEQSGRRGLSDLGASDLWMEPMRMRQESKFQQLHWVARHHQVQGILIEAVLQPRISPCSLHQFGLQGERYCAY